MIFRALAHLEEQLGKERFRALIDSGNTGKVKNFCDGLIKEVLPSMTIGGRTYEILAFHREEEDLVECDVMIDRAKEFEANLGEEDGEFLVKYQDQIPVELRYNVLFVFPNWIGPGRRGVTCVAYDGDRGLWGNQVWIARFHGHARLLRRK